MLKLLGLAIVISSTSTFRQLLLSIKLVVARLLFSITLTLVLNTLNAIIRKAKFYRYILITIVVTSISI